MTWFADQMSFVNHTVEQKAVVVLSAFQRRVCNAKFNGLLVEPNANVYWHKALQSLVSPRSPCVCHCHLWSASMPLFHPAVLRAFIFIATLPTFPRPITTQSHILNFFISCRFEWKGFFQWAIARLQSHMLFYHDTIWHVRCCVVFIYCRHFPSCATISLVLFIPSRSACWRPSQ